MSNRRKLKPQNPVSAMIGSLDGAQIPGGCDSCDAYQLVTAHRYAPDVHGITIYHDDDCPELAAHQPRERSA